MNDSYLNGKSRREPYVGGRCPRCGNPLPQGYPGAMSRRDNATELCSRCGLREALEDQLRAAAKAEGR